MRGSEHCLQLEQRRNLRQQQIEAGQAQRRKLEATRYFPVVGYLQLHSRLKRHRPFLNVDHAGHLAHSEMTILLSVKMEARACFDGHLGSYQSVWYINLRYSGEVDNERPRFCPVQFAPSDATTDMEIRHYFIITKVARNFY